MRQARIGGAHAGDERIDDLGLDLIGEMAAVGDVLEAAPAVGDLLVLRQRVGDEREQPHVVLEHLGERFGGGAALFLVGVRQQVERQLERQRLGLAGNRKAQRRDRLVEQPVEGAARRLALLVEQPLELLLELVGLLLADVVDPRLVAGEARVLQRLAITASSIWFSSRSKKMMSVEMAVSFSEMSP